jgi:hypothetical protein
MLAVDGLAVAREAGGSGASQIPGAGEIKADFSTWTTSCGIIRSELTGLRR